MRQQDQGRTRTLDRRSLLTAAIGVVIAVPDGARAQLGEQAGSVEEINGEAFAEARAQRRSLSRAAPLFINDLVGTGPDSRLTLNLGKDTTLRLGQKTRLTIDRLLVDAGGEITLQAGPILFNRPAGSPPVPTRIKSAYGFDCRSGHAFLRRSQQRRVRCLRRAR